MIRTLAISRLLPQALGVYRHRLAMAPHLLALARFSIRQIDCLAEIDLAAVSLE
ncbi:MAG: hypothetical protein U0Q16_18990 [Bryobacteraceae bacterium]